MKNYEYVILDCMGVLLNWDKTLTITINNPITQEIRNISLEQLSHEPVILMAQQGLMNEAEALKQVCNYYRIDKNEFSYKFKILLESVHVNDDIMNYCTTLVHKKTKLLCLSNMTHETFAILKSSFKQMFQLFDGIGISAEVKQLKPNPDFYNYFIKMYDIKPNESLIIDDTYENIKTAKSMGFESIHYDSKLKLGGGIRANI